MEIRLRKIGYTSVGRRITLLITSILLSFIFCALMFKLLGGDPAAIYKTLFKGSFGTAYGLRNTFIKAIPLMLCGLGVSVAFKMRIWNIGAEGQLCMGMFAATGVALFCPWIPQNMLIPAMILASFLGGAVWAVAAVLPNALWKVNETIITLLMNYIAILWVNFLVYGPWRDPDGSNFPLSAKLSPEATLPALGETGVHAGLIIGIAAAIILYFVMTRTTLGYEITAIGESRRAANYGGISITRNIIIVMLISGGIAGIAGMTEVSGVVGRLMPNSSGGYGYTAIIIAYLSKFNPLAIVFVALLFGGLLSGGQSLQVIGVSSQIVTMMQGAILFFVLGGEIFTRYRPEFRGRVVKASE